MLFCFFPYGREISVRASVGLRGAGEHLLRPGDCAVMLFLFVVSFSITSCIVRGQCSRFQLRRGRWLAGAVSLLLPTHLLYPFSNAFFPELLLNMATEISGVVGGQMLWCCAGGLVGVTIRQGSFS